MGITARYEREIANLRRENDSLRERLSHLSDLSRGITSKLELGTVLQAIVEAASNLAGARYGALAIFDASGRVRSFITHGITRDQRERLGDLPRGLGLLSVLQHEQSPMRLADISEHPRSVGFPPNHPPMKSFLGAPVRLGKESLGNLYLTEKIDRAEFTPEDEEVIVLFASHAALAIRNAQQFEALEAERHRLESLVHLSPIGVLMIEAGSERVLMVNREAERILGVSYGPEDTLSDHDQALLETPDGSEIGEDSPILRALTRGETVRVAEVVHRFPDGRGVLTHMSSTPVYGENGQIVAAVSIIQDISPLEELEKLKSEFLGIVSHELRTPLTAIKGSAATVLGSDHPLDEKEIGEFFQIIDEQADKMRDLINNLLDVTRIEAGELSVTLARFDLREALEEARSTFALNGGYHDVSIAMPPEPTVVDADRRRIVQVLNNLLSNAGKYSPETTIIRIDVEQGPDMVTVHVRDEGRGLGSASLPHVFLKYYQAGREPENGFHGNGLGLTICKGIVEAHGGRIWAASPGEGQGTTFSFTLPIASDRPPPALADVSRRSYHIGKVSEAGAKTRVLAVDDEPQILRYMQSTLQRAGYRPIVTVDPSEVLGLIESEDPQVVLLDLMFPGASGFELLERIREVSGVSVICVTARDDEEHTVRALRLGADDYITKPFSPAELLARIEASLRRRVLVDQMEVRPPFELDGLFIEFGARRVSVSGEEVNLTPMEYKLLYELATNAGRALTHDQLLQRVWGPEYSGESQLVRAIVRNLRRKLGDDARRPRFIFTLPQVGYRMAGPHSS